MSATVLKFPEPKPKPLPPEDRGAQYICLNCDGREFHAYTNDRLYCVACGARMRNLFARFEEPQ